MKRPLAVIFLLAPALLAAISCSEVIEVHTRSMDRTCLVVEAFLNDLADSRQDIILSESINYFSKEEAPAVRGASVSVDDGTTDIVFTEVDTMPGVYRAPQGWCCTPGTTYNLHIDATVAGEERSCSSTATMPDNRFRLDRIDYMYAAKPEMEIDSLWMVALWGEDMPGTDYYFINAEVNGYPFPLSSGMLMDDKYFDGKPIICFSIFAMFQTESAFKKYGPCHKFLETGDEIALSVSSMDKAGYDYMNAFTSNASGSSMPLFSSQPANCPTNIEGKDVIGWFALWTTKRAVCIVDDPFRDKYRMFLP